LSFPEVVYHIPAYVLDSWVAQDVITSLSPRRTGFIPRPFTVGFVRQEVTLGLSVGMFGVFPSKRHDASTSYSSVIDTVCDWQLTALVDKTLTEEFTDFMYRISLFRRGHKIAKSDC
jgi:hypothetical protein